ncbi:MAG: hypothetical protein CMK32_12190 [Porticoccaceae bacterium]|nr:hypothetical protein [Porticoccaceae bacterium]
MQARNETPDRYQRQMALDEVGPTGQTRLADAHIVLVGAGGLGCPAGLYLAGAGIGRLTIIDGDRIERSNLHRQVAFTDDQVGEFKAGALARRLSALNPDVHITALTSFVTADNVAGTLPRADLILDCSDNFVTRYVINDFCLEHAVPWVFAGVDGFRGSLAMFGGGPCCFRCLYPQPPAPRGNCATNGVLGPVPGLLGQLQAGEALKYLLGLPTAINRLVLVDARHLGMRQLALRVNPGCRCQHNNRAASPPVPVSSDSGDITLSWQQWLDGGRHRNGELIDVRTPEEHRQSNAGGHCLSGPKLENWLATQPAHRPVGLYCQTGHRSALAARSLRAAGFRQVYSLAGGLNALSAATALTAL